MTASSDNASANCSSSARQSLTLERLHAEPALAGPGVRQLKISPDGKRVTFLRGSEADQFRLDLWQFDVQQKCTRRLLDSSLLAPQETLSIEEQARRERLRSADLSGIVDYDWSPDGRQLLVPLADKLYLLDLAQPAMPPTVRLVASGNVQDAKISPLGRYLSFVRAQNLFVIDLMNGEQRQLTSDGGGAIHNGEAEFVAQEEMHQRSGYCWAPDDSAVAFKRFDEALVPMVRRVEMHAGHTSLVEQRYPAAGEPNVLVSLMLLAPASGLLREIDLGPQPDMYLVRFDWSANGAQLLYQRQSRNQQTLELVAVDAATLAQRILITETSPTWVSIHADLHFLKLSDGFIWSSERSGRNHLYLHDQDGQLRHPISSGAWGIDRLLGVDEKTGRVYVASNRDCVSEQQTYALALDGSTADSALRITQGDGWHESEFAPDCAFFVDTFSTPDTPPQVSIRSADGCLLAWLEHNAMTAAHPYAPYLEAHLPTCYGSLRSGDGQTLHYSLIKPAHFDPSVRYPVFLSTYGGPQAQHVSRRWGNLFDQTMAQQGFVVFRLDNRGSARRERMFTDVIYQNLGACEVADQLAGIDWLAGQSFIDATRIGVFGWSYGGFMALRLLAQASHKIALGVAVAPVTDWALYDTHYTERYLGKPGDNPAVYKESGVLAHLDGLSSPLLLMHGMADDNVLFDHSTRLIDALVERGVQFDLMTYPGAKHGIASRAQQRHVLGMIAAFFQNRLGRRQAIS